jgi:cytochrome P450
VGSPSKFHDKPGNLAGMATMFYLARSKTAFALIGSLLVFLAEHPSVQRALRQEPSDGAIEAVIEEALRLESPVQYMARTVRQPVTLYGETVPTGVKMALIYGAANRDPQRWDRPGTFDPARPKLRNLAFGEGIHFCIGAPVARLEPELHSGRSCGPLRTTTCRRRGACRARYYAAGSI